MLGLTVDGLDSTSSVSVTTFYQSPHTDTAWPLQDQRFERDQAMSFVTPAAVMRQPGDLTFVRAEIDRTGADGVSYGRYATAMTSESAALTFALPAELVVAAPTLDSSKDPRATFTLAMAPATLAFVDHHTSLLTIAPGEPSAAQPSTLRDVWVSASWIGDRSSVTVTTPDLSALPGWSAGMALVPAYGLLWEIAEEQHDAAPGTALANGQRTISRYVYST